ncbi:hypothetical protein BH11PAT1_BH11PAT1_6420 [soil metagenome]
MKQKDLVLLFGTSCFVVIAWIGFSLYNTKVTSTIDEAEVIEVKPIDGTFDTAALDLVRARQSIVPLYSLSSATSGATSGAKLPVTIPSVTATPIPASASAGRQL